MWSYREELNKLTFLTYLQKKGNRRARQEFQKNKSTNQDLKTEQVGQNSDSNNPNGRQWSLREEIKQYMYLTANTKQLRGIQ